MEHCVEYYTKLFFRFTTACNCEFWTMKTKKKQRIFGANVKSGFGLWFRKLETD